MSNDHYFSAPPKMKKTLTIAYIHSPLKDKYHGYIAGIVFLSAFLLIFGVFSAFSGEWPVAVLFLGILAVFAPVSALKTKKKLEKLNTLNIRVACDVCTGVERNYVNTSPYYNCSFSFCGTFEVPNQSLKVGQRYYVVLVGDTNKIEQAYSMEEFELSSDEFYNNGEDAYYYPIKGVKTAKSPKSEAPCNAQEYYAQATAKQWQGMDMQGQMSLRSIYESVYKCEKAVKTFFTMSIIGYALHLVGVFCSPIAILHLVISPFVFIVPTVKAFSATRTAKLAVNQLEWQSPIFIEISRIQTKWATKMVFCLLFNILAWLVFFIIFACL